MNSYRVKVVETTTRYFDIEIQVDRIEDIIAKTNEALRADGELRLGFHDTIDGRPINVWVEIEDYWEINNEHCI